MAQLEPDMMDYQMEHPSIHPHPYATTGQPGVCPYRSTLQGTQRYPNPHLQQQTPPWTPHAPYPSIGDHFSLPSLGPQGHQNPPMHWNQTTQFPPIQPFHARQLPGLQTTPTPIPPYPHDSAQSWFRPSFPHVRRASQHYQDYSQRVGPRPRALPPVQNHLRRLFSSRSSYGSMETQGSASPSDSLVQNEFASSSPSDLMRSYEPTFQHLAHVPDAPTPTQQHPEAPVSSGPSDMSSTARQSPQSSAPPQTTAASPTHFGSHNNENRWNRAAAMLDDVLSDVSTEDSPLSERASDTFARTSYSSNITREARARDLADEFEMARVRGEFAASRSLQAMRDRTSSLAAEYMSDRRADIYFERAAAFRRAAVASVKMVASKAALETLQTVELISLPEDERTCIICYNDFGTETPDGHTETPIRLPKCHHVFGDYCIKQWFKDSDSCPYCRCKVPSEPKKSDIDELRRRVPHGPFSHVPRDDYLSEQSMRNESMARRQVQHYLQEDYRWAAAGDPREMAGGSGGQYRYESSVLSTPTYNPERAEARRRAREQRQQRHSLANAHVRAHPARHVSPGIRSPTNATDGGSDTSSEGGSTARDTLSATGQSQAMPDSVFQRYQEASSRRIERQPTDTPLPEPSMDNHERGSSLRVATSAGDSATPASPTSSMTTSALESLRGGPNSARSHHRRSPLVPSYEQWMRLNDQQVEEHINRISRPQSHAITLPPMPVPGAVDEDARSPVEAALALAERVVSQRREEDPNAEDFAREGATFADLRQSLAMQEQATAISQHLYYSSSESRER